MKQLGWRLLAAVFVALGLVGAVIGAIVIAVIVKNKKNAAVADNKALEGDELPAVGLAVVETDGVEMQSNPSL